MLRRDFCSTLTRLLGLAAIPTLARVQPTRHHLIQTCPLAGFEHHEGAELWSYLTVGDRLELKREPDNPHDPYAIRVEWNGRKLGYIPRSQNRTTARLLDDQKWLEARIGALKRHGNPWRRVDVEVWLVG